MLVKALLSLNVQERKYKLDVQEDFIWIELRKNGCFDNIKTAVLQEAF